MTQSGVKFLRFAQTYTYMTRTIEYEDIYLSIYIQLSLYWYMSIKK